MREVARLTGLSVTTSSSALQGLHSVGLLTREAVGQNLLYRISPEHVLVAPLRTLSSRARDVDDIVAGEVKRTFPRAEALWLYGSRAGGREGPDSDADLLILFGSAADAARAAGNASLLEERLDALLGFDVSLTCAATPRTGDWSTPFWSNVLREGASLAGPEPRDVHDLGLSGAIGRHRWPTAS